MQPTPRAAHCSGGLAGHFLAGAEGTGEREPGTGKEAEVTKGHTLENT